MGPPVSTINKTYHHDITEILLKVSLNTIKQNKVLHDQIIALIASRDYDLNYISCQF